MDLLMDIAAARKRLRKLRLAIDEHTCNTAFDDTCRVPDGQHHDDEMLAPMREEEQTAEADLEALLVRSPASLLHKKCAAFFPTLLQSLDIRGASGLSELQGLTYFPMDESTFLSV